MPASVSGLVPPLKWHGGKHYLAGRIVALMPPHTTLRGTVCWRTRGAPCQEPRWCFRGC